jgi:acetoacetyl-CoA synthetase
LDRFGQIEPKILITTDGYFYNGKQIDRLEIVRALSAALPTLNGLLLLDYLQPGSAPASWPDGAELFDTACAAQPIENYVTMPFLAPLYILYSSGTTGAPKCIVHSAGGTLLQHIKEHRLHSNVGDGDTIFYFTTCGWMMWNWLASGLAMGAHLVLFDGNPFMPGPERLWQLAAEEKVSLFGTSAKYIDAVRKSGYRPADKVDLSSLRTLCSTGSPLTSDGFDYVYQGIKSDLQLASISGGTDIVSCFVLGCPVRPVYAGEIQARGLGMDMAILDEAGKRLTGEPGELCCLSPFSGYAAGILE